MGGNDDFPAKWQAGLESTIGKIDGPAVDVLADVPNQGSTSAVCLSAHLEDARECAIPVGEAFEPSLQRTTEAAAVESGATFLDLSRYFCNETNCPAIIGNTLVYRDGHHLTAHFSREMAGPLWKELEPTIG
ncbi:SGNH hydrolase domain-containing protein [Brachybacterium tyrofermentans]|uniref:SGNH hydrolase domain-containing protein n=1 Tax=Brachybacterium tyrofermentans TaxID=47848 RepID=UPI003F8DF602